MDFQKYKTNLTSQLTAVNAEIVEKEEELGKLKDFRIRVKGGLEVITQIESDISNSNPTPPAPAPAPLPTQLQQEIRETVEDLAHK